MKHIVALFLFVLLFGVNTNAQIFVENFNYTDGALVLCGAGQPNATSPYYPLAANNVSGGVWVNGSSSSFDDPMLVQTGALIYSGYSESGVGKKLLCPNLAPNTSNNRGYRDLGVSLQTVYYSFMIKIQDVTGLSAYPSSNGEYFTGVWATGNATNANYRGLTVFRAGSAAGTWQIGVRSNQPTTPATTWLDIDLDPALTYLIVVKYERNNPTCKASLWLNPTLGGSEPSPSITNNFGAVDPVGTNTDIGRFGIYQRGSKPRCWLGGIRVATSWEEAATPVELSSLIAVGQGRNVQLSWVTKTEVNTSMFQIERTTQSTQIWSKVGEVAASGNSNSTKEYGFTDKMLNSGKYIYRLKMVDADGTFKYSDAVEAEVALPNDYAISQNYPNPFNPSTKIDFQLPFDSKVAMELYGITGEKVATIINGELTAGYHTADVNAGALNLTSGMYIYRMTAQNSIGQSFVQVKKLMLTK
jgi:hypothetical protein